MFWFIGKSTPSFALEHFLPISKGKVSQIFALVSCFIFCHLDSKRVWFESPPPSPIINMKATCVQLYIAVLLLPLPLVFLNFPGSMSEVETQMHSIKPSYQNLFWFNHLQFLPNEHFCQCVLLELGFQHVRGKNLCFSGSFICLYDFFKKIFILPELHWKYF